MESEQSLKPAFEPWLDLKNALDELNIDYKAADFTEEKMFEQFKLKSEEPNLHFWQKYRF